MGFKVIELLCDSLIFETQVFYHFLVFRSLVLRILNFIVEFGLLPLMQFGLLFQVCKEIGVFLVQVVVSLLQRILLVLLEISELGYLLL